MVKAGGIPSAAPSQVKFRGQSPTRDFAEKKLVILRKLSDLPLHERGIVCTAVAPCRYSITTYRSNLAAEESFSPADGVRIMRRRCKNRTTRRPAAWTRWIVVSGRSFFSLLCHASKHPTLFIPFSRGLAGFYLTESPFYYIPAL